MCKAKCKQLIKNVNIINNKNMYVKIKLERRKYYGKER